MNLGRDVALLFDQRRQRRPRGFGVVDGLRGPTLQRDEQLPAITTSRSSNNGLRRRLPRSPLRGRLLARLHSAQSALGHVRDSLLLFRKNRGGGGGAYAMGGGVGATRGSSGVGLVGSRRRRLRQHVASWQRASGLALG